jgi:uncharacterized membrane protein YbhN (UPF0104 family)
MTSARENPKIPVWTTLLGFVLFVLAFFWLHHVLGQYRWQNIVAGLYSIPTSSLTLAAVLTVCGYACLTLYELLGLRFAGVQLAYSRIALTAFVAYAIGHNVGMNTVSGGAIRYRAYSAIGLSPKQIGTVVAFGTFTFGLGAALLLGISLLTQAGVSGSVLHVRQSLAVGAGIALIGLVASYLVLSFAGSDCRCPNPVSPSRRSASPARIC